MTVHVRNHSYTVAVLYGTVYSRKAKRGRYRTLLVCMIMGLVLT